MKLARRNPELWFANFDRAFDDFFGGNSFNWVQHSLPAVNVKEEDEQFHIELAAPGLHKEDFKISLKDNFLHISVEQQSEHEAQAQKGHYTRKEFSYQSFNRSFRLPKSVNSELIDAKYTNGVLHLALPKKEEAKPQEPRLIEIG
ncbi:MAG: Hsp20/alpha crystallin family protein [Bacteroidota bacterium]